MNGGIHLEMLSVNCATQNAAQSRSDHHASHQTLDAHTQECTQKLLDRWCSEEERNHISAERGGGRRDGEQRSRAGGRRKLTFFFLFVPCEDRPNSNGVCEPYKNDQNTESIWT